ncbi:MAG TPA: CHAT domain-containing tetratricopeptide repeat protein [Terriglobia bacterium]|nr:CHAT domain-containing tetratricopeptide repeat protein [Terriglobia bacterium]
MKIRVAGISLALLCVLTRCPASFCAQTQTADEILAHARQAAKQGDARAALPEFDRALALYRAQHDRHGEAQTLNAIGNTYENLGDYDRALDFLNRALAIKQELGERLEIGKTLSNLGLVFWDQADYPKAIDHFNQSLQIAHEVKDQKLEGSVLNNLALVYDDQGEYTRSLDYHKQAIEIQRAIHYEEGESDALGNLGGWYSLLGRFSEAIPYYQQALEIDERLKVKRKAGLDLGNIGQCQIGLGQLDEALKTYDRALTLARETGAQKDEADWHKGKGTAYVNLGKYDLAREEYRNAIEIYERAGLKQQLIEGLEDDGNLHEQLGDAASAEKDFRRALDLSRAIGHPRGVTDSLMALGDLEWRRKRYEQAAALYQQAYGRAKEADDRGAMAASLIALSFALRDEGKSDEPLLKVHEALEIARQTGASLTEAQALYSLGELLRLAHAPQKAIEQYSAGMDIARTAGNTELEWQLAYGKGQALESSGHDEDALAAYQQAVGIIEGVRDQLREERFRAGYIEDRYQVYVAVVHLLLKMGKTGQAFQFSEKLRARSFLDLLDRNQAPASSRAEAELRARIRKLQQAIEEEESNPQPERGRDKVKGFSTELSAAEREYQSLLDDLRSSRPDYAAAHALAVPGTEEIQAQLDAHTALIEYTVADNALSIFVLTRNELRAQTVPVRSAELQSKVELFRALIAHENNRDWIKPGESLDGLLIAPIKNEGWLAGITQILLVPSGVLHYLPFAALPQPGTMGMHFLVQDYTVNYLPAASALVHAKDVQDPKGNLFALAPGSSRLRFTPEEARSVGRLYPDQSLVLVGPGATKRAFEKQADGFKIIHLAAHGSFDHINPMFSSVELEPDKQDNGRLQVYEILGLHLHSQLVTLSACETALGSGYFSDYPAGDEIVGLTRAFLYAGSSSVMASLWEVNDRSTLEFMRSFYKTLQQSDQATSLRQAQLAMIESHGRFSQPCFWAPFVLVGINK